MAWGRGSRWCSAPRAENRSEILFNSPQLPLSFLEGHKEGNQCLISGGFSLKRGWERVGKIESEDSFFLFFHLPFSSHFKSLVSTVGILLLFVLYISTVQNGGYLNLNGSTLIKA